MKRYVILLWVEQPGEQWSKEIEADHFAISNNGDLMLFGPPPPPSGDPMEPVNTDTLFAAHGAGCWDSIEELRE